MDPIQEDSKMLKEAKNEDLEALPELYTQFENVVTA